MGKAKQTTKLICILALGVALYAVCGSSVKIPLIGHITIDLGYAVFGAYLVMCGWRGTIVGVAGCIVESLLFSGWFPIGWAVGQLFIGLTCGIIFKYAKQKNAVVKNICYIVVSAISVFIGVALIKTGIECGLYQIPFAIKFMKNMVAFAVDFPIMLLGVYVGNAINKKVTL